LIDGDLQLCHAVRVIVTEMIEKTSRTIGRNGASRSPTRFLVGDRVASYDRRTDLFGHRPDISPIVLLPGRDLTIHPLLKEK
jgi:hypothetical protein